MSVNAFLLSQLFSDITGRKVAAIDAASRAPSQAAKAYGVYALLPHHGTVLLNADLLLLGSLAGVLVGLPEKILREQVARQPLDETLRDAMHEVLNITSRVLAKRGRAVLQQMITDTSSGEAFIAGFRMRPHAQSRFHVAMNGYPAGEISVLTQL